MPGLTRVEGPALILVAPEPLAGKTTLAAGLAQRLAAGGHTVALLRLAGDEHAAADAATFAALPFNASGSGQPLEPGALGEATAATQIAVIEAPSGDATDIIKAAPTARAVVVAGAGSAAADVAAYCRGLGPALAGVIVNRVPARRAEAVKAALAAAGLTPLAMVAEDRLLAAPTLAQIAEAIQARAQFLNASGERLVARPVIASISADPGQGYFTQQDPSAVIVRGDKPDLQLAALNAGAPCLLLTGGDPPLSYVLDRVEEDEVPLLQTGLDTVTTVQRIEGLFAAAPFGGEEKLRRIAELLDVLDATALLK
ncbi:MAG TPA: DRTGG domain-containing protein [Dehalococcoidia bacterium]|nr:DRTGG domain-containing protein [Dehalococcoidia bacterium]